MTVQSKSLLIIGGTSDIAKATAKVFAENGWRVTLCGRDIDVLRAGAKDIQLRISGSSIGAERLDILDTESFEPFLRNLTSLPDAVLCTVGVLGNQSEAEIETKHAELVIRTNFEGPSLFLGLVARQFEQRGSGTIVGISSVAGDRGRASNYVYGAAKAGFTAFMSGLRQRLARHGVHVATVKPGFVRTRMTEGMNLPGVLTADPAEVGVAVWKAIQRRRNVVYVRTIWALIMFIIRAVPESLFKRVRL